MRQDAHTRPGLALGSRRRDDAEPVFFHGQGHAVSGHHDGREGSTLAHDRVDENLAAVGVADPQAAARAEQHQVASDSEHTVAGALAAGEARARLAVADGEERIEMLVTLFRAVARREETLAEGRREPMRRDREIVLRTRIRLENGGTVLVGGPPIADGVLILALSARR